MSPSSNLVASGMDIAGLAPLNAKTNVAFDVFFDLDIVNATSTTAPKYEVMVWVGKYGPILPIGATSTMDISKLPKQNIGKETL